MTTTIPMLGKRFGRLTVIAQLAPDNSRLVQWSCRCACGALTSARGGDLRRGKVVSCGCERLARVIAAGKSNATHGAAKGGEKTLTYQTWLGMRQRCLNKRSKAYADYGGRGITITPRWNTYAIFLADMGEKPSGMSLDRKNNNLGYSAENCRWATSKQQANNRRAPRRKKKGT